MELYKVGRRIASERVLKDWTQARLAKNAGLQVGTVARVERGRIPNPRINTLVRIADALNLRLGYLLEGEDEG